MAGVTETEYFRGDGVATKFHLLGCGPSGVLADVLSVTSVGGAGPGNVPTAVALSGYVVTLSLPADLNATVAITYNVRP